MKRNGLAALQVLAALLAGLPIIAASSAVADDIVPPMPPIPDVVNSQPPDDNSLWAHYYDPSLFSARED
jgi:hypothetical protein